MSTQIWCIRVVHPCFLMAGRSLLTAHTHFKHTPFTLKCSLKQEQRCVIRCVRPMSTTRKIHAGEEEGGTDRLFSLSLHKPCHGFYLPSDKVGTSMTPPPPHHLLFTGCCHNTPEDKAWRCLYSRARLRQSGIKWKCRFNGKSWKTMQDREVRKENVGLIYSKR